MKSISQSGKVYLRSKEGKNGLHLYLDFYFNKKRVREYLKLYISSENRRNQTPIDHETLNIAKELLYKRALDIANGDYHPVQHEINKNYDKKSNFIEFFFEQYEKKYKNNAPDKYVWKRAFDFFAEFAKGSIKFRDINAKFLADYQEFLLNQEISQTTASNYYTYLITTLNMAERYGIIEYNAERRNIKKIKPITSKRTFLTDTELQMLINTPYPAIPNVKRIFLFACLTGLRRGDLVNLKWGNIEFSGDEAFIYLVQKKREKTNRIKLNDLALCLIGKLGNSGDPVFAFPDQHAFGDHLKKWADSAGINKNVTLHVGRHTFATFLLNKGVKLEVVSELLGHSDIKTTRVYAKLVDETKSKAIDAFDDLG